VIVLHVAITAAADYATRREAYRRAHLERLAGLRGAGAVIGGGPAPDGRRADLVCRLPRLEQLEAFLRADPYWIGGVWTDYRARPFSEFVEPWELPPMVTDGSRPATIVEGPVADRDMARFALIELRGAGRLAFGGLFEDGHTFALVRTTDPAEARGWLGDTGFWTADQLTARPLLHVL
jgi:uncharacterized protein